MKINCFLFLLICLFGVFACGGNSQGTSEEQVTVEKNKTILIQPLGDFPASLANSVCAKIKEINPYTIIGNPIALPQSAYYTPRKRYRADSLLNFLYKKVDNKNVIVLGLTYKDISTTKGNYLDYGVMGLARRPGNTCVVSTYRLSGKNMDSQQLKSQLFKVSIHELGHTMGLPHYDNDSTCYMRDAKGGNPIDRLTDFCWSCKPYLRKKGWKLE